MDIPSTIRPRRRLAFPFVVALYPLLWLIVWSESITAVGQPITTDLPRIFALVALAVVVSYALAVVVVTRLPLDEQSVPTWARPVIVPANATLTTVGIVTLALAGYISTSSIIEFPVWFDGVAGALGFVLGWPMMLCILVIYAIGNTFPTVQIPLAIELLAVLFGVALSAAWVFFLSGWLTTFVPPRFRSGSTHDSAN